MAPRKKFVLNALLKHNYFPAQKKAKDEVPPIFSTESLTENICKQILSETSRKSGYDQIAYRTTRYNNVPRILSIPHPKPYVNLVFSIANHWKDLKYIYSNEVSLIKPQQHTDGRIIIMNYEGSHEKIERALKMSFRNKFSVQTDISNCYPSIYSHAIPWALIGFKEAKAKKSKKFKNEWFNKIDEHQRLIKRGETQGVPIGPATSNIISEIILARIDENLSKDFCFIRFIDDYTCYCEKYEEAEGFVRSLSHELSKYNMNLNLKKTIIHQLPKPTHDGWVVDLKSHLPRGPNISHVEAVNYLDYALSLNKKNPDGSILKYAFKAIEKRLNINGKRYCLDYILNLAPHYPILIPTIDNLLDEVCKKFKFNYEDQLQYLLLESAVNYRSDSMCWTLYYLLKNDCEIGADVAEKIMATKDCLSILMVYLFMEHDEKIKCFVDNLGKNDLYELDQYWLLLYQLFFDEKIENPYKDENTFKILKENKINFIKYPTK